MPKKFIIHTDGGARGNPGPAGIGAILKFNGQTETISHYIGEATNNVAEYSAVIAALEKAVELDAEEVDLYLDSELVQQQLMGNYRVKNVELGKLFVKVYNLQQKIKKIKYIHIPREENKQADRLVNEALDAMVK